MKYRRSGSVSCVVADMRMPGISGRAVCYLSKPFAAEGMFECIRLALLTSGRLLIWINTYKDLLRNTSAALLQSVS